MVNPWTLSLFLSSTLAATPDQWRTRSIYQIMTDRFALEDGSTSRACDVTDRQRCGGTWKGLQNKLDYIQDLGFDAVWISPISKNIEDDTPYGQAYHGYWTQDLYQLNNHMGSEADLNDLVTEMHNRDMYLMVDGVPNHFAHGTVPSDPVLSGPNRNIDLTGYVPFDSPEDYHDWCWVDYANDTSVTQCWMGDRRVPLMDLNTESPSVNATLVNYIQNTTALYGIDGLRVDAVKSIRKDFWRPWNDAAGVYSMGEVYTGDPGVMCEYQHDALDALLNFPVWEAIVGGYNDSTRSLANIPATVESVARLCTDPTLLGSFIENQDLPRFKAYTTDDVLSHNAITYVMTADGIPVLYYGYEAGFSGWNDPQNREALWTGEYSTDTMQYGWVKKLNSFRKAMIYSNGTYQPTQMTFLANDIPTHVISFLKGDSIVVTNNYGDGSASQTVNVQTPWAGQSVLEMWSNTSITIPDSGTLRLTIENGAPMVFYPAALSSCVSGSSMDACQTGSTNRTAAPRPSVAFPSSSSSTATAGSTTTPSTTGSGDTATTSSEPNTSAEASTSGAESLLETFPATVSLVALALFAVMA